MYRIRFHSGFVTDPLDWKATLLYIRTARLLGSLYQIAEVEIA